MVRRKPVARRLEGAVGLVEQSIVESEPEAEDTAAEHERNARSKRR